MLSYFKAFAAIFFQRYKSEGAIIDIFDISLLEDKTFVFVSSETP